MRNLFHTVTHYLATTPYFTGWTWRKCSIVSCLALLAVGIPLAIIVVAFYLSGE